MLLGYEGKPHDLRHWTTGAQHFETTWWSHLQGSNIQSSKIWLWSWDHCNCGSFLPDL